MLPFEVKIQVLLVILAVSSSALVCNDTIDPKTNDCQPWAFWNTEKDICECSDKSFLWIDCFSTHTMLKENHCLYYDHQMHVTLTASCPFNSHKQLESQTTYVDLPNESYNLNSFMCDPLNRTGLFCSHCKEGLGPAMLNYSYPCLECTKYGWVAYFAATLLPATIFCLVFIAFHIDVTSPSISFVILHSQIIIGYYHQQPGSVFTRYKYARLTFITFIGFWNLEFFRVIIPSFCVSSHMTTSTVIALDYITALYPTLLIAIIYFVIELHDSGCKLLVLIWRPLHPCFVRFRKSWNIRGSVINAFTVFFCLSYSKIISLSFALLYQVPVEENCQKVGKTERVSFLNASMSAKLVYTPYFYPAIIIPFVFCLLPLLFLVLHQTRFCRKCLIKVRFGLLLHEMAKIFEQHFKNGTNNSRDCRWMSGLYFLVRIILSTSNIIGQSFLIVALYVTFTVTLVFAIARPYKENLYNNLDTMWFAILTIIIFCGWYQLYIDYSLVATVHLILGLVLPMFYFFAFLFYKVGAKLFLTYCQGLPRCFQFKRARDRHSSDDQYEELPDRLLHSSEYKPLLMCATNR